MSIMAKTPSGYKKIGSAYLGERPVDKVFNANGDVVYALQRELTGVLPLLFKGKEQSELWNYRIYGDTETKQRDYSGSSPLTVPVHDGELYNYRIYGNTVNGESVGEKTANLFDMKTFAETAYPQNATVNYSENSLIFTATQIDAYVNQVYAQINIPVALRSSCINVQPLTTYTISMNAPYKCFISWINDSFDPVANYIKIPNNQTSYTFTTPSNCTKLLIRLGKDVTNIGDTFTISNIMLNTGSTALPYEPYGYKVPVTISNGTDTLTTPIYLPEPIKMVGSEAEYVDFYSQKQYFADGTNTAFTIPALPISTGTNIVTVNTTVQPSNVEVSVDENVSVGDLVTSGEHAGEYVVPVTVEGKNLLPNTATSKTINGVTFTVNNDGSITCNGTATALSVIKVNAILTLPVGEFILTGTPTGGSGHSSYYLYVQTDNISPQKFYNDIGNGVTINNTSADIVYSTRIVIERGYSINNQTFYPMIRKAGIEDGTYEPYHAPVTTPIYLPEQIKMVGDEAEYIDYGEQKQHRVRKNLLPNTVASQRANGVTFTVNEDGSVTCNGTATSTIEVGAFLDFLLPPGNYRLTGCPSGGGFSSYYLRTWYRSSSGDIKWFYDFGSGYDFTLTDTTTMRSSIVIETAQVVDNITFYPMIRKADIEDDAYEPYIENTDLDVTLPALPTVTGTNVLTVGTEVQPSRMDIKGRIKTLT